jgi:hypothetical protein
VNNFFLPRMPPPKLSTMPGSNSASMSCASAADAGGRRAAVCLAVVTVRTTIDCGPAGVTVDGEKEHVLPAGSPEQEKETGFVNPPASGLTNISYLAACPAKAEAELLWAAKAKSSTWSRTLDPRNVIPLPLLKPMAKVPTSFGFAFAAGNESVAVAVAGAPAKVTVTALEEPKEHVINHGA